MALYVTAVDENSPAERFGLTVGCALLAIDGHPLNDALDYQFIQRPPRSPWKCVRTSSTAPCRSPRRSMSRWAATSRPIWAMKAQLRQSLYVLLY